MPDVCDGNASSSAGAGDGEAATDPRSGSEPPPADGPGAEGRPAWVRRSDDYARPDLELMRRFEPEKLAALGFPGVANEITQLPPGGPEERIAAHDQLIRTFGECLAQESHAAVRVDLESMIMLRSWDVELLRLESSLLLPYFNLAQTVFSSLLSLLTAGTQDRPAAAARRRLRRYAGLEEGYEPLARMPTPFWNPSQKVRNCPFFL